MKMPKAWLTEDIQQRFADSHAMKFAPVLLHGAVLSLNGSATPGHLVVRAQVTKGRTRWRAAWLHGTSIGYASMEAAVEGWGYHHEDEHGTVTPSEVTAWARPLSSVTKLSLTDPECTATTRHREKTWWWRAGTRVWFTDGEYLDLPLFGSLDSDAEESQMSTLVDEIRKSLAET